MNKSTNNSVWHKIRSHIKPKTQAQQVKRAIKSAPSTLACVHVLAKRYKFDPPNRQIWWEATIKFPDKSAISIFIRRYPGTKSGSHFIKCKVVA